MGLLRGFFLVVISMSLSFVFSGAACAQDATGRVIGTVFDQQGGLVPDASVTVTNTGTKISQSTVTDKDGHFEVLDLAIGNYRVSVEHGGFNKAVTQAEKLLINQSLRFDITLTIGATNQTVTVEATVTGVTVRTSGKVWRYAALSTGAAAGVAAANATCVGVPPTAAIAVRVAGELAAPA